jgi:hypothetical protein
VPNALAWEQIVKRFEQGWTARALASACGLPDYYFADHHAVWRQGGTVRLGPNLARTVMAMGRPTAGQVGAEPSRRRLRALAVIGYSLATLSAETGVKVTSLAMIRTRNVRCASATAAVIEDVYERLHMTPGRDKQAIDSARAKGWLSPLAWDDIANDPTPAAKKPSLGPWSEHVDEVMVQRVIDRQPRSRNLTTAEAIEAVRRLRAMGFNSHQIENTYGIKSERFKVDREAS